MSNSFLSPIIKNKEVNIDGIFKLPIGGGFAGSAPDGEHSGDGAGGDAAGGGQASARVIETTASYATIEVVCPCGMVSKIKCNYN
jgi:hypothetical protein